MSDRLQNRKDAHLDIVLGKQVAAFPVASGLGGWRFEYDALPELDLDQVDLSCTILGKSLKAPILIGAMTGGTDRSQEINRTLAKAAAKVGVGMALGSQRPMLVRPELTPTFAVREAAPDLPLLFGNLGAIQLNYGVDAAALRRIVAAVGADALNLHLNPLQEAIQPEGDTRFAGLWQRLRDVVPEVGVPVVVKEVGAGLSARTNEKLARLPIAGVEAAGVGGTSWAAVESYRAEGAGPQQVVGQRLAGFGIPTAEAVRLCRRAFPDRLVVGSGGVRNGLDVAVALALGADVVALAKPFLEAAVHGVDAVVSALEVLIYELKVIAFCTGSKDVSALRTVRLLPPGASFLEEERR